MAARPSDQEIAAAFRKLLAEGFYAVDEDGVVLEGAERDRVLAQTKPWRAEMWRKFRQIEDRMNPFEAFVQGRPVT